MSWIKGRELHHFGQGRPSDFQSWRGEGAPRKRAPSKGNLKAKIYNVLDIGIPLHCDYFIRDDVNICFTLYKVEDNV